MRVSLAKRNLKQRRNSCLVSKLANREPFRFPVFLCFQKSNVFVNCGSADIANPCQFADIQLLALVGGVVAKEGGGDVLFAHLRQPGIRKNRNGFASVPVFIVDYRMDKWLRFSALVMATARMGAKMMATAALKTVAGIFSMTTIQAAAWVRPCLKMPP